ncbi:MAG TPA: SDR family NAD(P)-dependent oxidoreductase [Acidimicrobiales bacterium]|nr:SDR family NAD(P)-dependent oxidoreductase [Acidimicrobiales bacterium]
MTNTSLPGTSLPLEGRTAAVTGGARGLGRTIVTVLAGRGADVAVLVRDPSSASSVAEEVRALGRRAEVVRCDLSEEASVAEAAATTLSQFGHLDVLVCNSGIAGPTANLWDTTTEEWWEALWVNVVGTFFACRAFLPTMIERRSGSVVLIGSMTGKRPLPGRTSYAASKLGLVGLARTLAVEVGGYGVRVNVVSPGPIEGERLERVMRAQAEHLGVTLEEVRGRLLRETALGHAVPPQDIADAVAFLAGDAAASITGEDLNVSAGMVMY